MHKLKIPGWAVALCGALASVTVAAATTYKIPWYVNPTHQGQIYLGKDDARVNTLAIEPAGKYLAVGAEADGDFVNVQAYKLDEIVGVTGVLTNGFTGRIASADASLGSAPLVAANSTAGSVVAVNPDLSSAATMKCGAPRWIGRFAPNAMTFGATDDVSSFALNTAGSAAWTTSTAEGRTGLLTEWTISNGAFTKGREIATGLSDAKGLAIYTLDGIEYAFVGEGDSSAATAGTVKRVNLASGAAETFVSDAAHLGAGIVSVRMSHADYFRPRLYALLATGDIACYYVKPEKTPIETTWSKTVPNAELLTAAKAPWTAEHATVTAFDVFPDGVTAVVAYRRNAGDETEADGATRLALLKHTPRKWTAYEVNDEGNPRQGEARTLTDGEWNLNFTWSGSSIKIGASDVRGAAWTSDEMHEFLDLTHGYAVKFSDKKEYKITTHYNWAFSTNDVSGWREPRVLMTSSQMNHEGQFAKGWELFEEVVFVDSQQTKWPTWGGMASGGDRRFFMNMPKLKYLDKWSAYGNNDVLWGKGTRFEDLNFPVLATIGEQCLKHLQAEGALTLPVANIVSNSCFAFCSNMTSVALGDNNANRITMHNRAFESCLSLKKVRFGGGAQVHFTSGSVFDKCPIEEVVFTGNIPTKESNVATIWPDAAERRIVFGAPRGNAEWDAVIADPAKLKVRFTAAEQEAYLRAHPGCLVPIGIMDKSVVNSKYDQLLAYNDARGGYALKIEKDEFFGDEVIVESDSDPLPDGSYMPGTTITLTAAPNAAAEGTFRKWYGDVPKGTENSASVTFTLNENRWIYCRMVHPWRLAEDKKTASNGNFTVNCSVRENASNHQLVLGKYEQCGLFANDDVGAGVCDLGGPVFAEGDATPWRFTALSGGCIFVGTRHGRGNADTLVSPGTIGEMTSSQFMHTNSRLDARSLCTFIFDEPTMTGTWYGWATCGHVEMTRMILQLPKLGSFFGDGSLWSLPLTETDLGWWDLSGVKSIATGSFAGMDWDHYVGGYGVLSLPSLRGTTGAPLKRMQNVEGFELGGGTKTLTVTNIAANSFQYDGKLRKVAIYNSAEMTVGANALSGANAIEEIWLQGPAIDEAAFANLLGTVTAAAVKPVKVYVSTLMSGWGSAPYLDHEPSAAEKAEAPGERVIAVYRGGAEAPSGKALIIHRAGPYDPKGTYIVIR